MGHLNPLNPNSSYINVASADMTAGQVNELKIADRHGDNDQAALGITPAIPGDTQMTRNFIVTNVVPNMPKRYK